MKNTLVRRAIDQVGMSELDSILNGTTSLAISKEDPIAPMRIINKYAKQMGDRFNIKAGFMEGQVLPLEDIAALAELPSKDGLVAQLLGMMLAPSPVWPSLSRPSPSRAGRALLPPRRPPLPSKAAFSLAPLRAHYFS